MIRTNIRELDCHEDPFHILTAPKSWLPTHDEPFQYLTAWAVEKARGTYYAPGAVGQMTSAAFV